MDFLLFIGFFYYYWNYYSKFHLLFLIVKKIFLSTIFIINAKHRFLLSLIWGLLSFVSLLKIIIIRFTFILLLNALLLIVKSNKFPPLVQLWISRQLSNTPWFLRALMLLCYCYFYYHFYYYYYYWWLLLFLLIIWLYLFFPYRSFSAWLNGYQFSLLLFSMSNPTNSGSKDLNGS